MKGAEYRIKRGGGKKYARKFLQVEFMNYNFFLEPLNP
jgi:hypothetical protein